MSAVGCPLMVAVELFVRHEMYGGVIRFEIVGHRHDFFTNPPAVRLISHNINDPLMRLDLCEALPVAGAGLIDRVLGGNGVLHTAFDTVDPAHGIGVTLR